MKTPDFVPWTGSGRDDIGIPGRTVIAERYLLSRASVFCIVQHLLQSLGWQSNKTACEDC